MKHFSHKRPEMKVEHQSQGFRSGPFRDSEEHQLDQLRLETPFLLFLGFENKTNVQLLIIFSFTSLK